jgi:hypothetical protein
LTPFGCVVEARFSFRVMPHDAQHRMRENPVRLGICSLPDARALQMANHVESRARIPVICSWRYRLRTSTCERVSNTNSAFSASCRDLTLKVCSILALQRQAWTSLLQRLGATQPVPRILHLHDVSTRIAVPRFCSVSRQEHLHAEIRIQVRMVPRFTRTRCRQDYARFLSTFRNACSLHVLRQHSMRLRSQP